MFSCKNKKKSISFKFFCLLSFLTVGSIMSKWITFSLWSADKTMQSFIWKLICCAFYGTIVDSEIGQWKRKLHLTFQNGSEKFFAKWEQMMENMSIIFNESFSCPKNFLLSLLANLCQSRTENIIHEHKNIYRMWKTKYLFLLVIVGKLKKYFWN